MPTRVRGLMLITANGQKYFIEGGIGADRIDDIPLAANQSQSPDIVTFTPIDNATIQTFQKKQRDAWFEDNSGVQEGDNVGPFIMQAYSVVLERDEDGNDSEVTGNGTLIASPDG